MATQTTKSQEKTKSDTGSDHGQMRRVTDKIDTLRTAVARSTLVASPETIRRLKANDLPKKDVLVIARTAGVMAAKKTSELIPYCHPLPIDLIEVAFEISEDRLDAVATVEAIWKTGVEMEALTAASVATLTVYDMLKPVDQNLEIVSTKLVKKKGGK